MTCQIEQRPHTMKPKEALANPPPAAAEKLETPSFQSLNELHIQHGNSPQIKDRVYSWGGGVLIGFIVFGALYLMIHFLEK